MEGSIRLQPSLWVGLCRNLCRKTKQTTALHMAHAAVGFFLLSLRALHVWPGWLCQCGNRRRRCCTAAGMKSMTLAAMGPEARVIPIKHPRQVFQSSGTGVRARIILKTEINKFSLPAGPCRSGSHANAAALGNLK